MQTFADLVAPYLDELYRFACRLERDPVAAEDLLQTSLLRGFEKHRQLRTDAGHRQWMAKVMWTTFENRRKKRTEPTLRVVPRERCDPARDPEERLRDARLGARIALALDRLPEERRVAVWLVDGLGFTFPQAAEILDMPPGTLASRVARGRAALRLDLTDIAAERGVI